MYQVIAIPAFSDNYLWALVSNDGHCAIVDPGDAVPVIEFLDNHHYTLTDILLTHHHSDHIGGVNTLLEKYNNVNVFGPNTPRFTMVNKPCDDLEIISLTKLDIELTVMEVPGHTIDHICYFDNQNAFVGDTLFSAGCGRLFEGTPEQMHHSLTKISQLDKNTNIYCAHEYTLSNIAFALTVDPDNQDLIDYDVLTKQQRVDNISTIPTKLSTQLAINPFLRSSNSQLKQAVENEFTLNGVISDKVCFSYLRKWKDVF